MKKVISQSLIFSILFNSFFIIFTYAKEDDSLSWKDAVLQCVDAYNNQSKNPSAKWNISNPFNSRVNLSCEWNSLQDALYQAILDVRFSKIDKEIENYLKWLDGNTDTIKANKELSEKFSTTWKDESFYQKYINACDKILGDAVKVAQEKKFIIDTNSLTKDMVWVDNENKCINLAKKKLNSYQQSWVVIIAREWAKAQEGSWKKFFSDIRDKYEKLLFKFLNYISQLWKIKDKWNTATPQAKNQ